MFDKSKSGFVSMAKSSHLDTKQHQIIPNQSNIHQINYQYNNKRQPISQKLGQPGKLQPSLVHSSVNLHDTNDIRYSRSNTELQLQRLSLSASLIDIYFGRHYRSPDVLVVAGLTMILIGLGAILIGVYVYFNEDEFQEMTFLVGFAMAGIGFICCSCRIILFGPPLFNCCLPIKSVNYNRQRRPTNPPFFTAASTAMSTVTCIGVRFNSGRSLSGVSHVIHINNKDETGTNKGQQGEDGNHLKGPISHGNSLDSIETIKDETNDYPSNQIKPINPTVLQYISKLGSKT